MTELTWVSAQSSLRKALPVPIAQLRSGSPRATGGHGMPEACPTHLTENSARKARLLAIADVHAPG